jgi:predicted nucleic acid-binding protein
VARHRDRQRARRPPRERPAHVLRAERDWAIFERLIVDADAGGNLVPDAYLAALCIEQGATWYSADRDYARFTDLDWRHPLKP